MPRKSNALKEAVAMPVDAAPAAPAKRGRPAKQDAAPAVDVKAAKKALAALVKQANDIQKKFDADMKAVDKYPVLTERANDGAALEAKKNLDAVRKAAEASAKQFEKDIAKAEGVVAKAVAAVGKIREKAEAAAEKERVRLRKEKEKADAALAKEIAALQKVIGSEIE